MDIKSLVGSGDKIGQMTLPVLVIGLILNIFFPAFFSVGGPANVLLVCSIIILIPGVVIWLWSVYLILSKVPKNELITSGPFALVKHPLYTGVTLLVLPWVGFLCNSWLGALVGIVMYLASRKYAPAEEKLLSETFGPAWEKYASGVKFPWL